MSRKKDHVYGKLAPQAVSSTLLAEDGEANFTTKEKKDPSDFALWKAAKPGEPSWASPECAGGKDGMRGRPGLQSLLLQSLTPSISAFRPVMSILGISLFALTPTLVCGRGCLCPRAPCLICIPWQRRLAHRMLGHGEPHAGAVHGHPHGRVRPGVPSPRE